MNPNPRARANSGPGYAKHPEHTVTVEPFKGRVVVETSDGQVLVDTTRALELREASYPPVYYIPRADTKMHRLAKTSHSSHCPFKGDASYFSIADLPGGENAVWSYETPFDEVASIREALAFYPNKVTIRVEQG
jgi:uncharacterized protein (DUF427 family)